MSHNIHLANAKGRDAYVALATLKAQAAPKLSLPSDSVTFRRYVTCTESGTNVALVASYGDNYAAQLVEGDPEVDIEQVGQFIEHLQTVYLDQEGQVLTVEPNLIEVLTNPDGSERERRAPQEMDSNTDSALPVRWTGKLIDLNEAVHKFSFKRRMQLRHSDGLTYEFLFSIAKELGESQKVMLLGTGEKGTGPLIFQANGRPYRGFLEGRVQGTSYQLTLLLSDMELKRPVSLAGGAA
jgi:hypothetical protein